MSQGFFILFYFDMERVNLSSLRIQSAKSEADARNHTPVASLWNPPPKKNRIPNLLVSVTDETELLSPLPMDKMEMSDTERSTLALYSCHALESFLRNRRLRPEMQRAATLSAAVRCSLTERHMPARHDVTISLDMQIFDGSSTRQSSRVPAGISRKDQSRTRLWKSLASLPIKRDFSEKETRPLLHCRNANSPRTSLPPG